MSSFGPANTWDHGIGVKCKSPGLENVQSGISWSEGVGDGSAAALADAAAEAPCLGWVEPTCKASAPVARAPATAKAAAPVTILHTATLPSTLRIATTGQIPRHQVMVCVEPCLGNPEG